MATNQQFNPHIKALRSDAEEAVAWLRLVTRSRPANLPESDLYNRRGMKTRVELAALLTLGPRSLVDAHELSPVEIFEAEPHQEQPTLRVDDVSDGAHENRSTRATVLPRLPPEDAAHHRLVGARFLHPETAGGDHAFARARQRVRPGAAQPRDRRRPPSRGARRGLGGRGEGPHRPDPSARGADGHAARAVG